MIEDVKIFGTIEKKTKPLQIEVGLLSFELFNGALRNIFFKNKEILRGIAYVSRDKNWGTYDYEIKDLQIYENSKTFNIIYTAKVNDKTQSLNMQAKIEGSTEGLKFSMEAIPATNFITNRTGFVILHPLIDIVGQPVEIEETNGSIREGYFPLEIKPDQPFFNIRSLTNFFDSGVKVSIKFSGDKFEMEDQRNWLDASFKTYSGSLLDSWPYSLKKGITYSQSVELKIINKGKYTPSKKNQKLVEISLGEKCSKIPEIGSSISTSPTIEILKFKEIIKSASLSYFVARLNGCDTNLTDKINLYSTIRAETKTPIWLELILSSTNNTAAEIKKISSEFNSLNLCPEFLFVTHSNDMISFQPGDSRPSSPRYEDLAKLARDYFPDSKIGGGVLAFFTELNRLPVPSNLFDFVCHSVCPSVHASDDLTVMQNLETIEWIVKSTRKMIGSTSYHLGPSSISTRVNPYGKSINKNPNQKRLCLSEMDPRVKGLFGASWMLGLVSEFSYSGIDSISLGALDGPDGMIYTKQDYISDCFTNRNLEVFPAFHILKGLTSKIGFDLREIKCNQKNHISTIAIDTINGPEVWIGNRTNQKKSVRISGISNSSTISFIDENNFNKILKLDYLNSKGKLMEKNNEVELSPYAVVRIKPIEN